MGRIRRVWQPEIYYHVTMRGNNRQNIFLNEGDFALFFRVLQYTYTKYPFTLIAYCIMNNHYHFLIRSTDVPLSKVMAMVNKRYSEYFKRKYNFYGQLYETRYFASMVSDPISLLNVSSYIHQNPINTTRAIVNKMEDYPFSSYRYYHYHLKPHQPFLDVELLPSIVKSYEEIKEADYCTYCENFRMEEKKTLLVH
ncbi:transposase [Psychrobacillus vulpis]|uniref:Transposase n=1 Tax=Psychrobacillus vulpis TaxID=2325572 RepID=A0A544TV42_9BACI|nr:transposase [Psychrobacillus vulpis]TQR21317.1 transposase [Psychrobacillus vulpis]